MFAPGLVCVALGVFVVDSAWMVGVGIVLLVAPLVVQMFGPDWDRETIPEGHHHDHHPHDHDHDPREAHAREEGQGEAPELDAGRTRGSAPDARGSGV